MNAILILIGFMLLISALIVLVFAYAKLYTRLSHYKQNLKTATEDIKSGKSRIQELETAIENEYGVRVQKYVTKCICDFSTFELNIILSAVGAYTNNDMPIMSKKKIMALWEKASKIYSHIITPTGNNEIEPLHPRLFEKVEAFDEWSNK